MKLSVLSILSICVVNIWELNCYKLTIKSELLQLQLRHQRMLSRATAHDAAENQRYKIFGWIFCRKKNKQFISFSKINISHLLL